MMLSAGVAIPEALRYCATLPVSPKLQRKLGRAMTAVQDGDTLSKALLDDTGIVPARLLKIVTLGEKSNMLGDVTQRIAAMLQSEEATSRELKQALIYPIILLSMSILVVSVLVFYLAPTLEPVFRTASAEPPAIIEAMLNLRNFVVSKWVGIIAAILVLATIGFLFRGHVACMLKRVATIIPVLGSYLRQRETLHFCRVLELMLSSGAQLSAAMVTARDATNDERWRRAIDDAQKEIEAGQTLEVALLGSKLLDPMARSILATAEKTDSLHKVLPPTVANLETQTSQTLSRVIGLLTPVLTLLIGVTVGAVILSTITAILDLNDAVL